MELTDEAKQCVLVFGYVWLEMISLCVMSFLRMQQNKQKDNDARFGIHEQNPRDVPFTP